MNAQDLATLRKPFAARDHEWLQGNPYITESAITSRIEDVDPAWSLTIISIEQRGQQLVCVARMTIKGVSRDAVGMAAIVTGKDGGKEVNEAEKSAATDALKRAARLFGVGRYLLDMPSSVRDEKTLALALGEASVSRIPPTPPAPKSSAPTPPAASSGSPAKPGWWTDNSSGEIVNRHIGFWPGEMKRKYGIDFQAYATLDDYVAACKVILEKKDEGEPPYTPFNPANGGNASPTTRRR